MPLDKLLFTSSSILLTYHIDKNESFDKRNLPSPCPLPGGERDFHTASSGRGTQDWPLHSGVFREADPAPAENPFLLLDFCHPRAKARGNIFHESAGGLTTVSGMHPTFKFLYKWFFIHNKFPDLKV